MIYVRVFTVTVAAMLLAVTPIDLVEGQAAPDAACITAVGQTVGLCLQPAGISQANFMWFVSNATSPSGTAPANADQFKTQLCNAANTVVPCILNQMGKVANTTCLAPSNQPVLIKMGLYFFTYDLKCANPCRSTVADDLRKCYVDNGLSGDLFMSNKSSGAIIGSNKGDASNFCTKKDSVLACMQKIYDGCPDAAPMLAQVDFSLQAYNKGINILCTHVEEYIKGIECFTDTTPEVDSCVQKNQQAFTQLAVEAQNKNMTRDQTLGPMCKITIDQVDCDLTAWLNKKHESCTKGAIGLRREMECNLLPANCTVLQKPHFDQVCNSEKFFVNDRAANGGGSGNNPGTAGGQGSGSGVGQSSRGPLLLTIAALILSYFKSSA